MTDRICDALGSLMTAADALAEIARHDCVWQLFGAANPRCDDDAEPRPRERWCSPCVARLADPTRLRNLAVDGLNALTTLRRQAERGRDA